MRAFIYILLVLVLITGCGFFNKTQQLHTSERIIHRDLTLPTTPDNVESDQRNVYDEVNVLNASMPIPKNQNLIYFVKFSNESSRNFDQKALEGILKKADKDDKIFVLGHSHGNSSVGTIKLSTTRAEKIGNYLKEKGFKNVFLMASWGKEPLPFFPDRGVQISIVRNQEPNKVHL